MTQHSQDDLWRDFPKTAVSSQVHAASAVNKRYDRPEVHLLFRASNGRLAAAIIEKLLGLSLVRSFIAGPRVWKGGAEGAFLPPLARSRLAPFSTEFEARFSTEEDCRAYWIKARCRIPFLPARIRWIIETTA